MSVRLFEGPAGTGKTTSLMAELATIIEERPLCDHEKVLALTKMHGSRRRLNCRLAMVKGLYRQFECVTADSFAWRILRRWRSLSRIRFGAEPAVDDYDEVCRRAGVLLCEQQVCRWVARAYPVLIVDEMQDCKGGQIGMVEGLSRFATCLAAADDYQDLDGDKDNPAVSWAHENAEVTSLTQIHRTTSVGLLAAAFAIRGGMSVPSNGSGFTLLHALNHNVGASHVSRNLTWWQQCNDIVVITPVRPANSTFVRKLIIRVEQGPIGKDQFGPYCVPWEESQEEEQTKFLALLNLPSDPSMQIDASDISLPDLFGPARSLSAWLDRQRRVAGRTTFTVAEIQEQVRLAHQRSRAYRRDRASGIRAMTVHQAKNREFDSVIVLWPYEVQGSPDRQRRLLYNAITRAKRQALVVVQNPNRLNAQPFKADG